MKFSLIHTLRPSATWERRAADKKNFCQCDFDRPRQPPLRILVNRLQDLEEQGETQRQT